MADKQQNIVVNLKFNTAEAERYTQITNRANEATNKLQQGAQATGKKLGDSFRQPIQSIESMRVQLAKLKASLDLAVDPQKVKQLSAQYKDLKKRLDEATNAAYKLNQESSKTNQILGQVGSTIAAAFSAAAVRSIVDAALSLATLAGNAEGVERAFNNAFKNAPLLLDDLRNATNGTLTDVELMQKTLQATNLGVSVEGLATLFEFAAARAQQTGESVDYLVNSIVTGIGRKSIRVIDNLGISAVALKEELGGVSAATASVAEVTQAVSRIAQRELQKLGGYAETSATQVSQIKVEFEEVQVEAGKAFNRFEKFFQNKTGLPGFLSSLELAAKGLQAFFRANGNLLNLSSELLKIEQETQALQAAQAVRQKAMDDESLDTQQKKMDFIQQEINSRVQIINTYQEERRNNADRLVLLKKSAEGSLSLIEQAKLFNRENEVVNHTIGETNILNRKGQGLRTELVRLAEKEITRLEAQNVGLKTNEETIKNTIELLKTYLSAVEDVTGNEEEQLGIIEAKRQEIDAISDAIEKTRSSSDLSSRLGIGKLITDLAVAQAELKELLEGPENKSFNLDVKSNKKTNFVKDFEKLIGDLAASLPEGAVVIPVKPTIPNDLWDDLQIEIQERSAELFDTGIGIFADQLVSFEEAEVASLQNRLNNLRNFYDEQQILAGDNERAKQELRLKEERETTVLQKKIAQKEKEARRFSVIIDTAAGIARAFATSPTIAQGIINAALVAAQGASQLAIINRTQPRFKDGVINLKGPGTSTSDSIQARLSKGESVMTAKETQSSMGILKDIRAKKLNDKVLQDLKLGPNGVTNVGMDDSRLLKKLDELKPHDIVEQNKRLYKVINKGKDYKQKVRVSIMGY